eukprot:gene5342-biopygen8844
MDRVLFKIRRFSFINFPLLEEERAKLDSIGMQELLASFRWRSSVYRGGAWIKSAERWNASIVHLNKQTYVGCYTDEVEAALSYDAAAIALGETDGLNFPEKMSDAMITDALLLKLFKTTDRDKVKDIVEEQQKEKGDAISETWKALLKRNLIPVPKDPKFTGGEVGRKRTKFAPRGWMKKADMSEGTPMDDAYARC